VAVAAVLPLLYRPPGLSRNAALTWGGLIFLWWGSACIWMAAAIRCFWRSRPCRSWPLSASCRSPGARGLALDDRIGPGHRDPLLCRLRRPGPGPDLSGVSPDGGGEDLAGRPGLRPCRRLDRLPCPTTGRLFQPDVAWHPRLTLDSALDQVIALVTNGPAAGLICIAVLLAISLLLSRREEPAPGPDRALVLAAVAGMAGLAIILATGLLKPTLTSRYLIPTVPSVLLCLILAIRGGKWRNHLYGGLLILYALIQTPHALERMNRTPDRPSYEFETVSEALAGAGITDLVFVWDHELAPMMDKGSLARVGGVFVERLRKGVPVTPLVVDREHDPNLAILAAARGEKPGIIWLYNREGRTASAVYAPAIPARDKRWTCVRSGDGVVGSVGCYLKP